MCSLDYVYKVTTSRNINHTLEYVTCDRVRLSTLEYDFLSYGSPSHLTIVPTSRADSHLTFFLYPCSTSVWCSSGQRLIDTILCIVRVLLLRLWHLVGRGRPTLQIALHSIALHSRARNQIALHSRVGDSEEPCAKVFKSEKFIC